MRSVRAQQKKSREFWRLHLAQHRWYSTRKELKLTIEALEKPPRADLTSPNPAKVEQALQEAVANLSQQDMSVIADTNAYTDQPSLVCNATLALYQHILALPYEQRIYALRGMFQSDI